MAQIAVDIDDTLYSFTDEAREVLSIMIDQYPEHPQLQHALYSKWDQWRTPFELCGFDGFGNSLWLEVIRRAHDEQRILAQQPYRDAVRVVNELADAGHELIYISNRATETEEATYRWLVRSSFPIGTSHKLVIVEGPKANKNLYLKDAQYMIDDRPKNIIDFIHDREWIRSDRPDRKGFVRVTDYNGGLTDVPNLYLAHTWAGLRRYMVSKGLIPEKAAA